MKTKFKIFTTGQVVTWASRSKAMIDSAGKPHLSGTVIEVDMEKKVLTVIPEHRRNPASQMYNVPTHVDFGLVLQRLEIVPLGAATYAELQLAASHIGASIELVEASPPTTQQIEQMLAIFKAGGYTRIQIDPANRVKDAFSMVPFGVAVPLKRESKVHTLRPEKDLTKIEQGKKFLKQFGLAVEDFLKEERNLMLKYLVKVPKRDKLDAIIKTLRRSFGKPHIINMLDGTKQYRWKVADGVFQMKLQSDLETGTVNRIIAALMA